MISWSRHAVATAMTTAIAVQHNVTIVTTIDRSSTVERIPMGTSSRIDDIAVKNARRMRWTLSSL